MEPTATASQPATGQFWPAWLVFHFLFWIVAWVAAGIVSALVSPLGQDYWVFVSFIVVGLFGSVFSLATWLSLRSSMPRLKVTSWLIMNFLGWSIGLLIPLFFMSFVWFWLLAELWIYHTLVNYSLMLAGSILSGAIIGVAQWLMLRRHAPRASRWILGTIGAMVVIAVINIVIFEVFVPRNTAGPNATDLETLGVGVENFFEGLHLWGVIILIDMLLGGLIYGAVTGSTGKKLRPQAQPVAPEQPQSAPDTPALT